MIDWKRPTVLALVVAVTSGPLTVGQAAAVGVAPSKRLRPAPSSPAFEIDPLRIIKSPADPALGTSLAGPNIVIALDTSLRMAYDYLGNYYDLRVWDKDADPLAASALGVSPTARYYRRRFGGLQRSLEGGSHFKALSVEAVDETEADYATFFDTSRLGMVRDGLAQAVGENQAVGRFGLVRSRYGNGAVLPAPGNQGPVGVVPALPPGDAGMSGAWRVSLALTSTNNVDANISGTEVIVRADSWQSSAAVLLKLQQAPGVEGALLPAGGDADLLIDAPITRLLDDTRSEVVRLIGADVSAIRTCRNTVVVLIVGGRDGSTIDPVATARSFANISVAATTKPVPIFVVAVGPSDGDTAQLQQIAAVSGGKYFAVTNADEIALAVNHAVQSAYRLTEDFNGHRLSEFSTAGPVVGTVDLAGAKDVAGAPLPDSRVTTPDGSLVRQWNNVLVTAGFTLPGFQGNLRAFRVYRPQSDSSRPTGYRFVNDGTPLWIASTPQPENRNLFTYLPGTGMVPFSVAQVPLLRAYLSMPTDEDAAALVNFVRDQPLGAVIDSMPAIMNPPSLEPAPDLDYGTGDRQGTFAGDRSHRRALVFYGGNDGMIHAVDGRLGVEVWAFIPFNFLPKLRSLRDGQPVGNFEYFADSSPRIVDVKVSGRWRTYLIVGQGAGGTFYQTFDVSDAGLAVRSDSDSLSTVLGAFTAPSAIPLIWSFPRYQAFDHTISTAATPYGDLGTEATAVERTVGQTWSTPAVGQVFGAAGRYVMMAGSGYLSHQQETQAGRNSVRAGTTFYVLDMSNGAVLDHQDVGDDPARNSLKNALHADPVLAGRSQTRFVDHAYIGDTEGRFWRFNLVEGQNGAITLSPAVEIHDSSETQPIFTSPAVVDVHGSNEYLFLSTGSPLLPSIKKREDFRLMGLLIQGGGAGIEKFNITLGRPGVTVGDERPVSAPAVAGEVLFMLTTTDFPDDPCKEPEAELRALTYVGGPAYDTTNDDKVDARDDVVIAKLQGRGSTIAVVDRHVLLVAGSKLEGFGDPQDFNNGVTSGGVRVLAWREIR